MASSPSSSTSPPPSNDQQEPQQQQSGAATTKEREKEYVHKTKTIQFLGRTTPIVLQNDNGPCPLLAICNVLLLRNNLNLSPDAAEVSQEKLLSLVAERLIDSNCNVNNKDAGYLENQQQNIADAIDLLPRLATGIDVNIKFRRIDDFEFTRECAIFDLLDIPLYHGWIVDTQDFDTAEAIGSKSYNTLMGELVALETQIMVVGNKNNPEEDSIDFAAATTATLGVPSPSLSKTQSFDESPRSASDHRNVRKGDLEEEAELLKALNLSQVDSLPSVGDSLETEQNGGIVPSDENSHLKAVLPVDSIDTPVHTDGSTIHRTLDVNHNNLISQDAIPEEAVCSSRTGESKCIDQPTCVQSGEHIFESAIVNASSVEAVVQIKGSLSTSAGENTALVDDDCKGALLRGEKVENDFSTIVDAQKTEDMSNEHEKVELLALSSDLTMNVESDLSSGKIPNADTPETYTTSSVDGSEPIYEGEECVLETGATVLGDREPLYEGEVILAEQADKTMESKDEITPKQGELIKNFLKSNASQLTFYGLFCLQDGLKERELCVFFRNNHFSTMFKYEGELYLLATDQGYINQPDLVWEKLNEVNGDTLFMTGNFKEFKVDSHSNDAWNEQNAMTNTADYIASIDSAAQAGLEINSDLQLAIALQQQEFEQQQSQRSNVQQSSVNSSGSSRLITGPQPVRNNGRAASSRPPEQKPKEKCIVM